MATPSYGNWGPLAALQALLIAEEQVNDGEKDRKQTDLVLVRQLGAEELQSAIKTASVEQLDLALAHDALAVERKPHSLFLLLYVLLLFPPLYPIVWLGCYWLLWRYLVTFFNICMG